MTYESLEQYRQKAAARAAAQAKRMREKHDQQVKQE